MTRDTRDGRMESGFAKLTHELHVLITRQMLISEHKEEMLIVGARDLLCDIGSQDAREIHTADLRPESTGDRRYLDWPKESVDSLRSC
jgi:hypothetical protein